MENRDWLKFQKVTVYFNKQNNDSKDKHFIIFVSG